MLLSVDVLSKKQIFLFFKLLLETLTTHLKQGIYIFFWCPEMCVIHFGIWIF